MASKKRSTNILALDVGTTTIRAFVYDKNANIIGTGIAKNELIYPQSGWVEMDPETLWTNVVSVAKEAITNSELTASDIACIGLATQRGTFITWDKKTAKPFHNFIVWKDIRVEKMVQNFNTSLPAVGLRGVCKVLHFFTRMPRFMMGSIFELQSKMVPMRLKWVFENVDGVKEASETKDLHFGTIDTWLLHKLSGGKVHLAEGSNASATGLFDIFTNSYIGWIFYLLGLKSHMMPEVVDSTSERFGSTDSSIFGDSIPIGAILGDQSASTYGLQCTNKGDMKMTLGTGGFFDCFTGTKKHASVAGIVPLMGWSISDEKCYLAEGANHYSSATMAWVERVGLVENVTNSSDVAMAVPECNVEGLYFIPAFTGLQAPINDAYASAGLIGLEAHHGKAEILYVVLESIAFGMMQLMEVMKKECDYMTQNSKIGIDGGVSKNDFVVQRIADLTNRTIERRVSSEMSALGVAFMAGIQLGIWTTEDLSSLHKIERTFVPCDPERRGKLMTRYRQWVRACYRFRGWKKETHLERESSFKRNS